MTRVVPTISLVIPAYNEEAYLGRLLDSVDAARRRYARGADAVEVIVADNDSTDGTAALARSRGCVVARTPVRMIAAVRNAGAAVARGQVLCFTDADGQIHSGTFDAVEEAMDDPRVVGGATGIRVERMSPGIAVSMGLIVPALWATGFDTGVVFCRRADFEALGGYDESLRFAEDVEFLHRLKRLGKGRGQRLTRLRRVKAIASARKFDEHGDWHYFPVLARGLAGLFGRGGVDEVAEEYWYDVRD